MQQSLGAGNGLKAGQKRNLTLAGGETADPPDRFLPLKKLHAACNAACSRLKTGGLSTGSGVGDGLLKVE